MPTPRRFACVFAGLCGAVSTLLPVAAVAAKEPPRIADSPIFKDFGPRWEKALKTVGAPGFAVVVVKDGEVILLDAMGVRDVESGKPVTPDTMFYIASATKPFNAMAALTLVDEGKLELDAPVKRYLPQLELADEKLTETLTVRDLLCHKYGINSTPIVWADAYTGQITDPLYFRLLKRAEIEGQPSYTNVHFTLLGRVIQSVTGKHWRDYLEESVLLPAGMTRTTGYASRMYGDADCAYPHIQLDGKFERSPVMKTDRTMHAAGGMGTTARDLGRWLILNMNRGEIDGKRIISKPLGEAMLTYQSKLPEPSGQIRERIGFGLGWGRGEYRDRPYAFHGGGYVGAAAYISFLLEDNIGMAVLVNNGATGGGLTDVISVDIYDKLLGLDEGDLLPGYEQHAERYRTEVARRPEGVKPVQADGLSLPMERYVGKFHADDWGTFELVVEDGKLKLNFGDMPFYLYTTGTDACDAMYVPYDKSKVRFVVDGDAVTAVEFEMMEGEMVRFERM